MAETKKQSFFGGAAVLAGGIALVKVIGAVFAIPLFNILGDTGAADFNNAYNIYSMLLMISTAGLPVALSKLVSEANTLGRGNQARRTFRVSFAAFVTLGVLSFLVMWFGDEWCAGLLHNPNASYGIRVLAPAVVCVGCLSAFRGYAQGSFRMTPTAVSQILEALCKLVIGLALAQHFMRSGQGASIAAAGAIGGVTAGTILALVYMAVDYLRHRPRRRATDRPDPGGVILRRLASIAVPITVSSAMVSVITLVDTSLVQGQLQNALGYSLDRTRQLYGTYSAAMKLYNLPASLMVALTASVIPSLSASLAAKDRAQTARVTNASLRVTALLAFPMGLGLWALAEPIVHMCYPHYDVKLGGELLEVLGVASLFVCLTLISNSILQAHGAVKVPI
ncbi:MAG: polysaccharide biosynthesis protein, partial [Oscillospiraceae bacterium]|nr:polysaccharide biosynthesis protein [Oscillospiraceae bacterium]